MILVTWRWVAATGRSLNQYCLNSQTEVQAVCDRRSIPMAVVLPAYLGDRHFVMARNVLEEFLQVAIYICKSCSCDTGNNRHIAMQVSKCPCTPTNGHTSTDVSHPFVHTVPHGLSGCVHEQQTTH